MNIAVIAKNENDFLNFLSECKPEAKKEFVMVIDIESTRGTGYSGLIETPEAWKNENYHRLRKEVLRRIL